MVELVVQQNKEHIIRNGELYVHQQDQDIHFKDGRVVQQQ